MRVFVGPTEVSGYYAALVRGLRARGVDVIFADFTRDVRRYTGRRDMHPIAAAALRALGVAERMRGRSRLVHRAALQVYAALRFVLLLWAVLRARVFVFTFGGSITWYPERELRLLRRLGKRIIFVFHGSDSRPPYLGTSLMTAECGGTIDDLVRETRIRGETVRLADQYADVVVDNPFSGQLHRRPYVNWQAIGIPFVIPPEADALPVERHDGRVRILHCPSAPEIKGTARVRAAVSSLASRGYPIDYVEITGRPHAEVLDEIRRCDVVVDQTYSDTPMAGFATEAAAYGRPSVIAGYAGPYFRRALRDEWMPPVMYCHPNDLEPTIERLIVDRALRRDLGRQLREYVQRERNPEAVADRYIRLFTDDIPAEWMFDPSTFDYPNGGGDEVWVRGMIRALVQVGSPSALLLDHAPRVRDALLQFAGVDDDTSVAATPSLVSIGAASYTTTDSPRSAAASTTCSQPPGSS